MWHLSGTRCTGLGVSVWGCPGTAGYGIGGRGDRRTGGFSG